MRKIILVVDEDLAEAREKIDRVVSLLCQYRPDERYSVLSEVASKETTISRCRNLILSFIFIKRDVVVKKIFGDLADRVKKACPGVKPSVSIFSDDEELRKIIKELEVRNGSDGFVKN